MGYQPRVYNAEIGAGMGKYRLADLVIRMLEEIGVADVVNIDERQFFSFVFRVDNVAITIFGGQQKMRALIIEVVIEYFEMLGG